MQYVALQEMIKLVYDINDLKLLLWLALLSLPNSGTSIMSQSIQCHLEKQ